LDETIQSRFAAVPPGELGMSRVALPSSFGGHFVPIPGAVSDYRADTPSEQAVLRGLSVESVRTGFYVFGAAITHVPQNIHDYRALKGPAVVTPITMRQELPPWSTVYPLARDAMKAFEGGARTFEGAIGEWRATARAVRAESGACLRCHNSPAIGRAGHDVAIHDAIGGVLYLYR
jgi:hypothetical protein